MRNTSNRFTLHDATARPRATRLFPRFALAVATWSLGLVLHAQTNPSARTVPFVEPFPSGTFSTYATGFQGWNGLSGAAITTQPLAEASVPTGDATLTALNPITSSAAGLYGSNGRVVLRSGSDATNGVNQLAMAINTTGQSGVRLSYSVTSVLAGPVTMGVVCQFRVGIAGAWTTLTPTAGINPYVQTSGFSGLKTAVGILLPVACDNQPVVQVRWAVWRGTQAGNSAAFGIDDVAVTLLANDECVGALPLALQSPADCPAAALSGSTVGATDSGADCVISGTDVWYTITGDQGQAATVFLTPGTATGMGLQVVGNCGGSVFYCQAGTQHVISVSFGSPTLIKVFAQTPGTFTICAVRAPANNSVFFATPLPSNHPDSCTAVFGTTVFASHDGPIPCAANATHPSVWYAVDGGAGLAVNIQLSPITAAGMGIQVFSDNGSTPTYCGLGNQHSFQAFGTSYRVQVFASTPGTFGICAVRAPANNESISPQPLTLVPAEDCNCASLSPGGCPPGEIADCSGNCAPLAFIGDGFCDDATFFNSQFISFDCAAFGFDGGDCAANNGNWPPICEAQLDSTTFATNSGSNCAFPTARDLWYSVTGGGSSTARIELFPITAANLGIEVFNANNTTVYCSAGNSHGISVPQGETYRVKVFTGTPGAYHLCAVLPPVNDELFTPQALTLQAPGTCTPLPATLAGATMLSSSPSCALPGSVDIWYSVVGGPGMAATLELLPGTAEDMGVQVLDAPFGNETYCALGTLHQFQVPFGSTYFVRVFARVPGTFTLCATEPPANNEQSGALTLPLQQPGACTPLIASTTFATPTSNNIGCAPAQVNDLWFTVTGQQGMAATLEITPISAAGLGIQVLNGPFGTETYCGTGTTHVFQLPFGSTYLVRVFATTPGAFSLCAIAAPDNNESFNPQALTPAAPGSCTPLAASTLHATALDPNCVGTNTRDLWYTVPSVPGQTVTIELVPGTATGLGVQVFDNQFGSVGAELYCAAGNLHTINVPVGQSRYLKVITSTPGIFTMCAIETVVECLVNGDCNDNNACTIDACLANTCVTAPLITVDEVFEAPDTTCINGNIQLGASVFSRTPINQYDFSTGTGAALAPMTFPTFLVYASNDNDPTPSPVPIGFTFPFNGTQFSHFSASPDGWIQLGMGTAAAEPTNNVVSAANLPKIYPYWDDLFPGSFSTGGPNDFGGVNSVLSGTAPQRILHVEWFVNIPRTNLAPNSRFQLWLHENGVVEFRYGTMGTATLSASIGMTGSASVFQSVSLATNTVSTSTPNDANTGQPASGRFYRFTPPQATGLSYVWSPATFLNSTTVAQPLASGINVPAQAYSVQVSSTGGCQATEAFTVHTAPPLTGATINGVPGYCAGGGSTTLTAVPVGGGPPFTYLWSPGGQTTASISVNAAGAYSCAITNPCGTVNSNAVNVVEFPLPTASAANNGPICEGDTLRLFGTSDIGDVFQWVKPLQFFLGDEDPVIPNSVGSQEGTWNFTATLSATGCTSATATTVVTMNSIPSASNPTATPNSFCSGGGSQLKVVASAFPGAMERTEISFAPIAGSGATITNWSNGVSGTANDGFSAAIAMPFTFKYDGMPFNQLFVGTNGYITFLDPAGITAQQSRSSSNMSSTVQPNAVVALCFADLNVVAPGVVSTFTTGSPGSRIFVIDYANVPFAPNTGSMNGQIHLHETTNLVEVHAGTHNFGTSTATSPNFRLAGVEKRDGSAKTLGAVNLSYRFTPLTYQWSPTTFLNDATIAEPIASAVNATTTYTITVNNSGCLRTRTLTVTAAPLLTSATITGNPSLCNGAATTLTAVPVNGAAPFTFLWSPGGQTTSFRSINTPGTYTCQITSACGGTVTSAPVVVAVQPVPIASAFTPPPVCEGGTIALNGSSDIGTTFSWTGPNGFSSTQQNPSIPGIPVAGDGIYRFTASANGCTSAVASVPVVVHPAPQFTTLTATPSSVCTNLPSQLDASTTVDRAYVRITEVVTQRPGTGATPAYPAYIPAGIDDFVELNNTSGIPADISGWSLAGYFTNGTSPTHPVLTFPVGTVMPPNSALVVGMGPGASSAANNYFTVGSFGATWSSGAQLGVVLKNGTNDVVDAVATGTTFVWHPSVGVTAADWTNSTLAALTGRAGIVRTAAVDTDTGVDWANANSPGPLMSLGTFNTGYTNPYQSPTTTYAWSPATFLSTTLGATTIASGVNAAISYTVQATSAAGCTAVDTLDLGITSPVAAVSVTGTPDFCSGASTVLTAVPANGGAPFSYLWSPGGATTQSLVVNDGGIYSCQVNDACGGAGANTGPVVVVEKPVPSASATAGPACLGQTLSFDGTSDIGTTFTWAGSNGFSSTQQDPTISAVTLAVNGTYSFVAAVNGCNSAPIFVSVTAGQLPVITSATASASLICPGSTVSLAVGTAGPNYCTVGVQNGICASDEFLSHVTLTTLDHASGCAYGANNGYSDHTAQTAQVTAGASHTMSITITNAFVSDVVKVFADWNGNGSLDDAGEAYTLPQHVGGTITFPFAVPATAYNGNVRMRVRLVFNAAVLPCGISDYGETEDYTLVISGGISPVQWSPTLFLDDATSRTPQATGILASTTYTVTVTNGSGCTATAQTGFTVPLLDDGDGCTIDQCVGGVVSHVPAGDTDGDLTCDPLDGCPLDPNKTVPGACGCGALETDTDGDLLADCVDACPSDPDNDQDGDGLCGNIDNCPTVAGQIGDPCNDGDPATTNDVVTAGCTCTGTLIGVRVNVRVMLEGPYNAGTDRMNDALRASGLLPGAQPYSTTPFSYSGTETVAPAVLAVTGDDAVVDWVLVELRNDASPSVIVARRAGLMQRDGNVVDVDGLSPVLFAATPPGTYRIAVRHRNHLGVMTATGESLAYAPATVDLTAASTPTHGTATRKSVGARQVLWTGNARPDTVLKYTGAANDRDPILVRIGGSVPTAIANGYFVEDVTLDGVVKYTNVNNDRDAILVNILSLPGGNVLSTRSEQLP